MRQSSYFRAIILALSIALTVSLCACGEKLTPEENVMEILTSQFWMEYGWDMKECVFTEVDTVVVTRETLKKNPKLVRDGVDENDIIFRVTYDIKAGSNPEKLTIENGEIKGQWIRDAYVCGYLKYISEGKYRLYSIGTGF